VIVEKHGELDSMSLGLSTEEKSNESVSPKHSVSRELRQSISANFSSCVSNDLNCNQRLAAGVFLRAMEFERINSEGLENP